MGMLARLSAKDVAMVAVFAALYVALSLLPGLPTPGDPTGQIKIEIEASLAPLYGIVLGPYLGALAAFLGTLIAWMLPPSAGSIFGVPALFCPAIDALAVGLMLKGRWKAVLVLLAALIGLYWLSPICLPTATYWYVGLAGSFDKLIALALVVPTALGLKKIGASGYDLEPGAHDASARTGLLYALSFIGNEADSALGCMAYAFFLAALGMPVEAVRFYYVCAPVIYFLVRVIQALIATAVGVPLLRALKKAGVDVLLAV